MYISVRVVAAAKLESLEEIKEGRLKISVKEPAKQNLANRRVTELLAKYFNLPANRVRLISGHTSPSKIFSVDIPAK